MQFSQPLPKPLEESQEENEAQFRHVFALGSVCGSWENCLLCMLVVCP